MPTQTAHKDALPRELLYGREAQLGPTWASWPQRLKYLHGGRGGIADVLFEALQQTRRSANLALAYNESMGARAQGDAGG